MNIKTNRVMGLSERLIVALDVAHSQEALHLVDCLQPLGVTFKVGMELFYREGMAIVHAIQQTGSRVFVDLKLHDIPHTVERAASNLVNQGVSFFNVHAQGGPDMLRAAVRGGCQAAERDSRQQPMIIGVTLLTSVSPSVLQQTMHVSTPLEAYVLSLASLVQESGLDGVVCSAQEAPHIRDICGPDFVLITPGIRPAWHSHTDDQRRIVTPHDALQNGAHFIVVGRPITQAKNPVQAADNILQEMKEACPSPSIL